MAGRLALCVLIVLGTSSESQEPAGSGRTRRDKNEYACNIPGAPCGSTAVDAEAARKCLRCYLESVQQRVINKVRRVMPHFTGPLMYTRNDAGKIFTPYDSLPVELRHWLTLQDFPAPWGSFKAPNSRVKNMFANGFNKYTSDNSSEGPPWDVGTCLVDDMLDAVFPNPLMLDGLLQARLGIHTGVPEPDTMLFLGIRDLQLHTVAGRIRIELPKEESTINSRKGRREWSYTSSDAHWSNLSRILRLEGSPRPNPEAQKFNCPDSFFADASLDLLIQSDMHFGAMGLLLPFLWILWLHMWVCCCRFFGIGKIYLYSSRHMEAFSRVEKARSEVFDRRRQRLAQHLPQAQQVELQNFTVSRSTASKQSLAASWENRHHREQQVSPTHTASTTTTSLRNADSSKWCSTLISHPWRVAYGTFSLGSGIYLIWAWLVGYGRFAFGGTQDSLIGDRLALRVKACFHTVGDSEATRDWQYRANTGRFEKPLWQKHLKFTKLKFSELDVGPDTLGGTWEFLTGKFVLLEFATFLLNSGMFMDAPSTLGPIIAGSGLYQSLYQVVEQVAFAFMGMLSSRLSQSSSLLSFFSCEGMDHCVVDIPSFSVTTANSERSRRIIRANFKDGIRHSCKKQLSAKMKIMLRTAMGRHKPLGVNVAAIVDRLMQDALQPDIFRRPQKAKVLSPTSAARLSMQGWDSTKNFLPSNLSRPLSTAEYWQGLKLRLLFPGLKHTLGKMSFQGPDKEGKMTTTFPGGLAFDLGYLFKVVLSNPAEVDWGYIFSSAPLFWMPKNSGVHEVFFVLNCDMVRLFKDEDDVDGPDMKASDHLTPLHEQPVLHIFAMWLLNIGWQVVPTGEGFGRCGNLGFTDETSEPICGWSGTVTPEEAWDVVQNFVLGPAGQSPNKAKNEYGGEPGKESIFWCDAECFNLKNHQLWNAMKRVAISKQCGLALPVNRAWMDERNGFTSVPREMGTKQWLCLKGHPSHLTAIFNAIAWQAQRNILEAHWTGSYPVATTRVAKDRKHSITGRLQWDISPYEVRKRGTPSEHWASTNFFSAKNRILQDKVCKNWGRTIYDFKWVVLPTWLRDQKQFKCELKE